MGEESQSYHGTSNKQHFSILHKGEGEFQPERDSYEATQVIQSQWQILKTTLRWIGSPISRGWRVMTNIQTLAVSENPSRSCLSQLEQHSAKSSRRFVLKASRHSRHGLVPSEKPLNWKHMPNATLDEALLNNFNNIIYVKLTKGFITWVSRESAIHNHKLIGNCFL